MEGHPTRAGKLVGRNRIDKPALILMFGAGTQARPAATQMERICILTLEIATRSQTSARSADRACFAPYVMSTIRSAENALSVLSAPHV